MTSIKEILKIAEDLHRSGMYEEEEEFLVLARGEPSVVEMATSVGIVQNLLSESGLGPSPKVTYKEDHIYIKGVDFFRYNDLVPSLEDGFRGNSSVNRDLKFSQELSKKTGLLVFIVK